MVLQRGQPVHVWGKAAAGEAVSVAFRGASRSATADPDGVWSVWLPSSEAGGPFEMTVKGTNTIALRDVLVGDVWVASGQSNMEMRVRSAANAEAEIAAAGQPRIRLLQVNQKVSGYPLADADAKPWMPCTPETVPTFSAVAYYFGRDLSDKLAVPIGLINTSWGGTPADSWTSLHALSSDAALMPVFASWSRMNEQETVTRPRRQKQLADWRQAADQAKTAGTTPPDYPWAGNDGGEWAPASLFNAMIAPLTAYPIRGVIWYQGESNASPERAPLYARLFRTLIQDWRRAWGQGDFPFLFVQLANFKTQPEAKWPEIREAQFQTLALANTGMAVTSDIGDPDNIHPKNKQEVGRRLALAARALAYGEKIEYSGPLYRKATREGRSLRVWFDHTGRGLTIRDGAAKGFEVAAADRVFVPAEARAEGDTMVVSSPAVAEPAYVRYSWRDNPDGNLYNTEGLPASPFRSGE
jgi:sialate O-acetylesterase